MQFIVFLISWAKIGIGFKVRTFLQSAWAGHSQNISCIFLLNVLSSMISKSFKLIFDSQNKVSIPHQPHPCLAWSLVASYCVSHGSPRGEGERLGRGKWGITFDCTNQVTTVYVLVISPMLLPVSAQLWRRVGWCWFGWTWSVLEHNRGLNISQNLPMGQYEYWRSSFYL